jgi:hypothetical protein
MNAGPCRTGVFVSYIGIERNQREKEIRIGMRDESKSFTLTMDELRVVARFAVESAQGVLPLFERDRPDDSRPRAAIEAARAFVEGARRTNLQRTTALDAHRAAKDAFSPAAKAAASAAGDAAAAAYLHPLPKATQVGHILRATAYAAHAAELAEGGDTTIGDGLIERARHHATPTLIDVLRRYPPAPDSKTRVGQLMKRLDILLRSE